MSGAYLAWQRERARLEIAYAGIAERVEGGHLLAIDRAMRIAERKAALLGLDARPLAAAPAGPSVLPTLRAMRAMRADELEAL